MIGLAIYSLAHMYGGSRDITSIAAINPNANPVLEENENKGEDKSGNNTTENLNNTAEETQKNANNSNSTTNSGIKLTVLGEIMMGGDVSKNLDYMYSIAFKDIYNLTRSSDFTYSTLSTNITNLPKIDDNTKSKYLVTKEIINGFNSLGIDSLSVASDHMVDFNDTMFKTTVDILNQNDIFVSGLNSSPVYLEKGNKKIAIISATNVIIGTNETYSRNGINVYELKKMTNDIQTAKENADIVIVDMHWGREYTYGVTSQMKTIAKGAIDAGADLIIGSHALGVYPVIEYKGKPIVYSTGYLMTDADTNLAKESCIFDFNINSDGKIGSIELTPIYILDKKQVKLYYNYDQAKAQAYLNQLNEWNKQNGLNSNILDEKIVINF